MYRKTAITTLCTLALICFHPSTMEAQRTMQDQDFVTAQASVSCAGFSDFGGSFSWGRWHRGGAWTVEASCCPWTWDTGKGADLHYLHAAVGGNWIQRIVSDRRHIFNLYAGGGALLGVQVLDPMKQLPPHLTVEKTRKTEFLYGAKALVQAEVWFVRRTAFTITAESTLTMPHRPALFHFALKAGVRVAL